MNIYENRLAATVATIAAPTSNLDPEIFAGVDPEFKWAATDKDSCTWFYTEKPTLDLENGEWNEVWADDCHLIGHFDDPDWHNSLIERPAHLTPALKELTHDVFLSAASNFNYAICDADGRLYLTEQEPELVGRYLPKKWGVKGGDIAFISGGYSAEGWQETILKRIK